MTFEDYQVWGWGFYALASLVVLGITFRMTASWPLLLRNGLRMTAVIVMSVPWYVQGDTGPMAPAIIISLFEALTIELNAWARAGKPLLLALLVGYILTLLHWRYVKKRDNAQTEPNPERVEPQL